MNVIRNAGKATLILGALLSAGLVLAQAPLPAKSGSNATQAAPAQQGNSTATSTPTSKPCV
jgi:hypothetical protein